MILLIGAGYMAAEYSKVLKALGTKFTIIGRGIENCQKIGKTYPEVEVIVGGLEKYVFDLEYAQAIVATGVDSLYHNTELLLKNGIKEILLEKPGGMNLSQIKRVEQMTRSYDAKVFIAYNRRFYSSVRKIKDLIHEDDGVLSFNFEFTEWPHLIQGLELSDEIKRNWFLANSSHVVDTAFYLGGFPKSIVTFTKGSLSWHPSGAIFSGAGVADSDALFSYQANWISPGRWSVEVLTKNRRLILRPMEQLQVQELKSVLISPVSLDDSLDKEFKPGLYLQTKSFVEGIHAEFCSISEQLHNIEKFYSKISSEDE